METWTNGRFVATPHRVINRDGDNRYSMPFFTNPDYDAIVAPVPGTEGYGDDHPPMVAGENTLAQYRKSWPAFGEGEY
jgi:isopenicillin N synthase-like dioxygenase